MTPVYEYVALEEIWFGGVRAFNVGDPVPSSHVTDHNLKVGAQVAKAGTKTAGNAEHDAAEAADSAGLTPPVTTAQGPAVAVQPEAKPTKSKG
ncbi:hypothetical protein ACFVH6_21895 [Spirillospora sp. NPDC127200]